MRVETVRLLGVLAEHGYAVVLYAADGCTLALAATADERRFIEARTNLQPPPPAPIAFSSWDLQSLLKLGTPVFTGDGFTVEWPGGRAVLGGEHAELKRPPQPRRWLAFSHINRILRTVKPRGDGVEIVCGSGRVTVRVGSVKLTQLVDADDSFALLVDAWDLAHVYRVFRELNLAPCAIAVVQVGDRAYLALRGGFLTAWIASTIP